jgi:hypothetical protein
VKLVNSDAGYPKGNVSYDVSHVSYAIMDSRRGRITQEECNEFRLAKYRPSGELIGASIEEKEKGIG